MRPLVLGCAIGFTLVAGACSRNPPSSEVRDPGPQAIPSPPATLRLATAIEEPADAGADKDKDKDKTDKPAPVSLSGKTVLHVGDSMVGGNWGLTRALEQRFTGEGAKFIRDYKVSESIISYDHSPKLKELLAKHKPDIVILTLGTNDVFVPYPASMAGNVQNIVKRLGARECYWMGPPTWKPDTGIVQVLRDNVTPCKFFDSSNLKLQRGNDGIHPTDRGGGDWATSFWTFFRVPSVASPAQADAGVAAAPSP
jgi:hypothetical protein